MRKDIRSGKIFNDEHGITYTLEAILGVSLIIGAVLFFTSNTPYTAQSTGEHSKVQLVNIGRDTLDLLDLTPVNEIWGGDYWKGIVYRHFTLKASKKFVAPGEPVNFTVYYMGTDDIVYEDLTLEQTILGLDQNNVNIGAINGSVLKSFSQVGEYNIRAIDVFGSPTKWTNYVTISVGNYYLDTEVNGISANGSKIVSGVIYNSSGFGIPDLGIEILGYNYDCYPDSSCPPYAITSHGNIMEDFENASQWRSNRNLSENNSVSTQGNSTSLNGSTPDFWIEKINSSRYPLDYNDILSFDFFARTGTEKIYFELSYSDSTNNSNRFIWSNISVSEQWNRINLKLTDKRDLENICCHPHYPTIKGTINATPEVDTISIMVSNASAEEYYIDNMTYGAGKFSFIWPVPEGGGNTGTYYLQANDSSGNTSNRHRLIYSTNNSGKGLIYSDEYVIYETDPANITLIPNTAQDKFQNENNFNINQKFYNNYDPNKISISIVDDTHAYFIFNTSGDYYIFFGNSGQGGGGDPANAAKTNTILIKVLPIDKLDCPVEDCAGCSGLDTTELNQYLRQFMPYYVNFNLYLINPDGTICTDCKEWKEILNGYPTDEAVTINKLVHINKRRNSAYFRELRMVLWYK